MTATTGQRLFISRQQLDTLRLGPDPDAPTERPLADGELRLAVDQFALTSNNITYAAFGEAMKYWQFFPAPDAAWGCLPVWGFATVSESRCPEVPTGRRVWGFLPAGTHAVLRPAKVRASGFVDASPHRAELAGAYQAYAFTDADPLYRPELEGLQAVLKPLFVTAFLLDDFLADNAWFGARRLLLSSASSKTAFGTAFCMAGRRGQPGMARIVGLTSPANQAFTQGLGCYDTVQPYDTLEQLDPATPTLYVDFAGNAALRRRVHTHFGDALTYSSSIGGTHWQALGSGQGLPGPRPTLFFAPAQIKRRSAPPPEGWGPDGLGERLARSWHAFIGAVQQPQPPWVQVHTRAAADALEPAYRALLEGRADAREGAMLRW